MQCCIIISALKSGPLPVGGGGGRPNTGVAYSDFRGVARLPTNFEMFLLLKNYGIFKYEDFSSPSKYVLYCFNEKVCPIYFVIILYDVSRYWYYTYREIPAKLTYTYSTDVGVLGLRGWGHAQITVRHFGSRGKKG